MRALTSDPGQRLARRNAHWQDGRHHGGGDDRITGAWTSVSTDVSRLTLVTFMPNILGGNCVNA